jgi:hypothetical protein
MACTHTHTHMLVYIGSATMQKLFPGNFVFIFFFSIQPRLHLIISCDVIKQKRIDSAYDVLFFISYIMLLPGPSASTQLQFRFGGSYFWIGLVDVFSGRTHDCARSTDGGEWTFIPGW